MFSAFFIIINEMTLSLRAFAFFTLVVVFRCQLHVATATPVMMTNDEYLLEEFSTRFLSHFYPLSSYLVNIRVFTLIKLCTQLSRSPLAESFFHDARHEEERNAWAHHELLVCSILIMESKAQVSAQLKPSRSTLSRHKTIGKNRQKSILCCTPEIH